MNLMEIRENPELQPTETAEQTKNSETILQTAGSHHEGAGRITEKAQSGEGIFSCKISKKMKEFMQKTQKKQIQTLEEEKNRILSENHDLQEEIRKLNDEIQRSTNRTVRNAEAESIASEEQRRFEEQKRIEEQEESKSSLKKK